ncbi:MAG: macro domain-containing protein [Gemmatimonadaceae bacterium]
MIEVRVDDAAFFRGTAVARPVTAGMSATTALTRRLELAAGADLAAQLRAQGSLPVGSAVVTGAGGLASEMLISAVVASEQESVSASSVRRATLSALQRAADWQMDHVGFVPFGLGAGNLDIDESAHAMVEAIHAHQARARFPASITILVESPAEADEFRGRLAGAAT